ncbi:MAG: DUF192 domain-containing protein [Bacteroidota bacterium]
MRKKSIFYVGVGLIGLSMIAYLFAPRSNANLSKKLNQVPAQQFSVPFKKEGTLTFYEQTTVQAIKTIDLEIADSEQRITQGLMYRPNMPDTEGMLFIFPDMAPRSFWMRNTLVSLDIIFVDDLNRIVSIQEKTTPKSEQSLPSGKPAKYVVEVIGGFCEKYGVEVGDQISYSRF